LVFDVELLSYKWSKKHLIDKNMKFDK
jgi:hypothetical protein